MVSRGAALLSLLLVVGLAYAQVIRAGFIWDDLSLIERNPALNPPRLWSLLGQDMWCCDPQLRSPYYRPILMLSLALDRWLFGSSAAPAHLHSLAVHLACVAGVFRLLRERLTLPARALAAGMFGLHPIQSEAVVWVSARSDPLAALFCILAVDAMERRAGPESALYAMLAVFSKESAALLPLFAWCWSRGWAAGALPRSSGRDLLPACLGIAAALAVRLTVDFAPGVVTGLSPGLSLPNALGLGVRGLALLVVPWPLTSTASLSLPAPGAVVYAFAAGCVAGLTWLCLGRERWLVAAAAAAGAPALFTVATLATLGERYFYLPMVPLAAALASRLERVEGAGRPIAVGVAGGFAASLGILQVRLPDWTSNVTFFEAAVGRQPDAYSQSLLGGALWTENRPGPALAALELSLAAVPRRHIACLHVVDVASQALDRATFAAHVPLWQNAGCGSVAGFDAALAARCGTAPCR